MRTLRITVISKLAAQSQVLALGLGLALLAACGGGSSGSNGTDPANPGGTGSSSSIDPIQQGAEKIAVSIKSFESPEPCAELQSYLSNYAEQSMRQRLGAVRDAQYEYGRFTPTPTASGQSMTSVTAPGSVAGTSGAATGTGTDSTSASAAAIGSFTTTNVQTLGVDELDNVKNNDRHVFRLHRDADQTVLSKARYWPATDLALLSKAPIPSHAVSASGNRTASVRGMFVTANEQVVVLSALDDGGTPLNAAAVNTVPSTAAASASADLVCPVAGCNTGPRMQRSYIDLFDASATSSISHQANIEIGGTLIDARRRGDRVWILTQEAFRLPEVIRWSPANFDYSAPLDQRKATFDRLIEQNALLIRAADVKQWFPEDLARKAGTSIASANQVCRSIRKVSESSELHWLRIASLNLSDLSISSELILAEGQTVYASNQAIYVSTPNWRGSNGIDPGPRTYIHKFSIADQGIARYSASGAFAGQPLNAYSFDEDDNGSLRFAANAVNTQTNDPTRPSFWEPYSYLGILKQDGQRLVVAAQSARIAPGERMQSARFVGSRGYLVTFRQVDPFYVYDMTASGGPKALGELKIPGFSTYLHPLGDRHMMGVGYAEGNWPRRIKASLFDVSDPTQPREQSNLILGDVYSASEALWDPHAFSFLPRSANTGTLAVPLWSFNYSAAVSQHSGLKILNVSADQGLSLVGELSVDDVLRSPVAGIESYATVIRRSILTDGYVFGIGPRILRSASLAKPEQPLATLITP